MDKSYLRNLRDQLPRGYRQILASRTGKSKKTVDHVLAGRRRNPDIIAAAINFMNEINEKNEMLKDQAIMVVENAMKK